MKMSWVTLDRICAEEMLSDEKIRRLVEGGNRPLRSCAGHLSDEELLDKLRGFGLDLDRRSLERLCEGAAFRSEPSGGKSHRGGHALPWQAGGLKERGPPADGGRSPCRRAPLLHVRARSMSRVVGQEEHG